VYGFKTRVAVNLLSSCSGSWIERATRQAFEQGAIALRGSLNARREVAGPNAGEHHGVSRAAKLIMAKWVENEESWRRGSESESEEIPANRKLNRKYLQCFRFATSAPLSYTNRTRPSGTMPEKQVIRFG